MPGICGLVGATDLLSEMLESMHHRPWYALEQEVRHDVGLGRVLLDGSNERPQIARSADDQVLVVLDGEFYDRRGDAECLLHGYLESGKRFLQEVEGKFSAAIWDGHRGQLILTNDKFGMKPLYFATAGDRFLFASEIKALLVDPELALQPNWKGIVQFFTFGHLWGAETLHRDIRALPPAAWVVYQAHSRSLEVDCYFQFGPAAVRSWSPQVADSIAECFQQAVDRRTSEADQLGLALSGGLDARTILAVTPPDRRPFPCVSLGMEGSLDRRSAEQLAALAGCPFRGYVLDQNFLRDFDQHLDHMVHLTDGHYLSQCIVMPTLPVYRELGIRFLLRGHAGELMHMHKAYNFSLDRAALEIRSEDHLRQWLFGHLKAYMLDGLDQPLFAGLEPQDADQIARDTIGEALEETRGWDLPVNRIAHLFITQRLRRETAMSLVKFGSMVETRLPYVDENLVSLLLECPVERRMGETIQSHILRRYAPAFMKPANSNTGARVGAGPLARRFHYGKMRVLAKLGVKGFQPYERLGLWLRRELREVVRQELLSDACLERGIFRPEAVRAAVHQHLEGQRNHTFLLLAMMIYQRGQRKFVDRQVEGLDIARTGPPAV
jgi:asparagine synthase (glutamine-hydrolysing)